MTNQTMDSDTALRWQANADTQRSRFSDYALDPAHTITLHPHDGIARIVWNGTIVADSRAAIALHERNHEPVLYFPTDDVQAELLARTDHATHCPYKGDASYWSLEDNGGTAENAVWAYESPIKAMAGIKGYMAFYLDSMGKNFGLNLETD
ncbi:MAG: DUF427 domain-containing protein [Rhodospirillaceae bacterium]|jgi:uncharacterized protein (DUF427 family)|nr:DUF427 domain-containing protein [Rhodospirillaceae bacterium]MBT5242068.1 DUF427 domain-containing protein [Rhodospirillaceae bacterium]MBT5565793.1 DUF427 domain-containing protein [Rhodospirillaceae bacterium]MBT6090313.1 DUF427 domain-containing protein [Rhodospirillaceae bacterium]MBT6959699.1 DUF427 domain-containing protein [Rhodospirillaceae bacterium]